MLTIVSITRRHDIDFWILVVGAVGVIPFLYSAQTADPLLTPRFLAWGGMCVGIFLHGVVKASGSPVNPVAFAGHVPFFTVLTVHLIISLSALTQAVNVGEGVVQWLHQALVVAFTYGAFLVLGADTRRIHWLTRSIILASLALGTLGWIQWRYPGRLAIPGHFIVHGTMGNKNLYASALFLLLPFVLFGMLQYRGKWRLTACLSFCLLGGAIAMTRTRSVWLAVATACVCVGVIWFSDHRRRLRPQARNRPAALMSLPVRRTMAVFLFVPLVITAVALTLTTGDTPIDLDRIVSIDSLEQRRALWAPTMRMALDRPIVGVGPGQWKMRLPEYGVENRNFQVDGTVYETVFVRPHNDFLWVLAENGVLGFICLLLVFGILICKCIHTCLTLSDVQEKRLAMCMLFGVVGMVVISCFSFPRERIFHSVYFAMIAALVLSQDQRVRRHPETGVSTVVRWRLVVVLGVCILCTLMGVTRYRSDRYFKQALEERAAGRYAAAIERLDLSRNRFYSLGPAAVPLDWYSGMMHFYQGRLDLAKDDFSKASAVHPFHAHSLNNAAVCHSLAGDPERASEYRSRLGRLTAVPGEE